MRNGPILAAAALSLMAAACGKPDTAASTGGDQASVPASAPADVEVSPEEKQKILAALPAPYNTADVANGEAKFGLCRSCHTIAPGGANMTGPNLHGIFGKKAAAHPDFKYSDALKNAGFVWDGPQLDQWLAKPQTFLPGTKMTFAGLKDEKDRKDLIAYLMVETGHKP